MTHHPYRWCMAVVTACTTISTSERDGLQQTESKQRPSQTCSMVLTKEADLPVALVTILAQQGAVFLGLQAQAAQAGN